MARTGSLCFIQPGRSATGQIFQSLGCMTVASSSVNVEPQIAGNGNLRADEIGILDFVQVLVDHLRLLIVVPLLVGCAALAVGFAMSPVYTAATKFLPPQQQQSMSASMLQSLGALGGLAAGAGGIKNPGDQYIAFLKSESVQDPLIAQFKLVDRFQDQYVDDARRKLEKFTRFTNGKDGLITIEYDDKDPAFAADMANAYVVKLADLLSRLAVTEAQQRRVFFERQLLEAKNKLIKAEQALKATGIDRSVLRMTPQSALEGIARLQAQISAQEVKVVSMRGYLAAGSPDLRQAQTELGALQGQLRKAQQEEPPAANGANNDYIARLREFKYSETLFELYAKQYELARVDESREGALIQVVDAAKPPERRSSPKRGTMAVVSALIAFFLIVIYAFFSSAMTRGEEKHISRRKLEKLRASARRAIGLKKPSND